MSNNKQSSIEWLCERLALKLGNPTAITFYIDHLKEIKQAKEMHEQEIKDAFGNGMEEGHYFEGSQYDYESEGTTKYFAEQYYNETFNHETN